MEAVLCDVDLIPACQFLKDILGGKVSRRRGNTRRFFGEAFVATQVPHSEGYYGSFQWLRSPRFLNDQPFPKGPTQNFQNLYRSALHRHFPSKLELLQPHSQGFEAKTGITPAAPDLWLVDLSGNHRFMEVKLPKDEVGKNQLAGLAVIATSFGSVGNVSVEIVELNPDRESRFADFIQQCDGTG